MRISDWSSDVCSSDLGVRWLGGTILYYAADGTLIGDKTLDFSADPYIPVYRFDMKTDGYHEAITSVDATHVVIDRKSVVSGKRVSVRVVLGGRRILKKKITLIIQIHNKRQKKN